LIKIGLACILLLARVTESRRAKKYLKEPEMKIKLTEPTVLTFIISVVVALVALLAFIGVIPFLAPFAFWIMLVAFVILALGNLLKGL
jgi:fatty acid desaturase